MLNDFRSWYTSALEQDISDIVGIAVGEGVVDGRFELVEKLDVNRMALMADLI